MCDGEALCDADAAPFENRADEAATPTLASMHENDVGISGGGGENKPAAAATMVAAASACKLYVSNVGVDATEADVRALFEGVAEVVSIDAPVDRLTGKCKGFFFVSLKGDAVLHAQVAATVHGSETREGCKWSVKVQVSAAVTAAPSSGAG